jgi:hypothetical protein
MAKKKNKGTEYEINFVEILTKAGLASPGHTTGGNGTDAYICDFLVELKKSKKAHYLQKTLHWINGKGWQFAEPEEKTSQVEFMKCLETLPSILEYINENWPKPTGNYEIDVERIVNLEDIQKHAKITNDQMMDMIRTFYYDKRNTYLHVGSGFGLYHFNDDHGHFLTPRFGGGAAKMRARLKKTKTPKEEGKKIQYHFQLQLELTSLPKSPIDLNDPVMLQSFIDRHRDGFISGKWKIEHWDRLKPLLRLGFITSLPPKPIRKDNEQVSGGFRSEAGSFSHSLAL